MSIVFALSLAMVSCACAKGSLTKNSANEALKAPSEIYVQSNHDKVELSWQAVNDADGYFVELSEGSAFRNAKMQSDTIVETQFTFSNLQSETTYTARLRAINKSNPSLTSVSQTVTFNTEEGPVDEEELAFPGADGYGKMTTGGRGGKVIKVTNLNDAGAGSLRDAISQSGKRIIVFEVSGNIVLKSRLQIRNGDLTIAGQTAPGDGICIQNYDVTVSADNVIIRFMRFRLGDLTQQQSDALWGRYQKNIIIDHCSMSWSIDECSSFYANQNFTMQWCLLAESLNKSFHDKDNHGYGAIWGGNLASFHHNLLAHHNSRNPRFDGGNRPGTGGLSPVGIDKVDYRNNVIYNWMGNSAYGGENGEYNIVNNYYKPGPATPSSKNRRIMQVTKENDPNYSPGYGKFYITGNYVLGNANVSENNWNGGVDYDNGVTRTQAQSVDPFDNSLSVAHSAQQAFDLVLEKAGASMSRDEVDQRIVSEVKSGIVTYKGSKTGYEGIIDSQTDVGGWPTLNQKEAPKDSDGDGMPDAWEIENGLDPAVANANGRDLSKVYDNVEVYINSLVNQLY